MRFICCMIHRARERGWHVMSCHVMSSHLMSSHVISCHQSVDQKFMINGSRNNKCDLFVAWFTKQEKGAQFPRTPFARGWPCFNWRGSWGSECSMVVGSWWGVAKCQELKVREVNMSRIRRWRVMCVSKLQCQELKLKKETVNNVSRNQLEYSVGLLRIGEST